MEEIKEDVFRQELRKAFENFDEYSPYSETVERKLAVIEHNGKPIQVSIKITSEIEEY